MMCRMRRPAIQMLYLVLLMSFGSTVLDASNAVYSVLHFRLFF